ncbi:hypothetical protein FRC09_016881 [Ceratobasidium sp. 395]|nr:hypothetical protein FRC09_016881 [Ceratobasidium sp. 395]
MSLNPLFLSRMAGKSTSSSRLPSASSIAVKLPRLIVTAKATGCPDVPKVTEITVRANEPSIRISPISCTLKEPEACAYQTLPSATRFSIIVPLSASKAPYEPSVKEGTDKVAVLVFSPKRCITIQRLGMQTPSPAWAIE